MIGYPVTLAELKARVRARDADWLENADLRLDAFMEHGGYADDLPITKANGDQVKTGAIWSEIKPVFMALQHDKCAYCERKFEAEKFGRIEHDLEHYRPKKKAKPWKVPTSLANQGIELASAAAGSADNGYHQLSYNLQNYCASCKVCNSTLKGDFFPTKRAKKSDSKSPGSLFSEEKPYLIFPLGKFDADPEKLIYFHGLSPMPKKSSGFGKQRAQMTIEFFHLNDIERKTLFRERAEVIRKIYFCLKLADLDPTAPEVLEDALKETAPHASCARSYHKLYQESPDEAHDIYLAVHEWLRSIS